MAVSASRFAAELQSFDGRRQIVKALRRALNRTAKPAIKLTRAYAVEILPSGGGLGAWVAEARIGFKIGYRGRGAGVRLRGSRKSLRDKSDLHRIDRGRVRAPAWGHKTAAAWHTQTVQAGWWTDPLTAAAWVADADAEVDRALDEIRRG